VCVGMRSPWKPFSSVVTETENIRNEGEGELRVTNDKDKGAFTIRKCV